MIDFFKEASLWLRKNWYWLLLIVFIFLAIGIILGLINFLESIPITAPVQSPPPRILCTADPGSKTPLTDVRFVILGLAVTLSTYISTVSRGVITSLKGDLSSTKKRDKKRVEIINDKQVRFWFLLISDILVWSLIIVPISWNIIHWFLCLPPTKSYFHTMRMWVFGGIYIYLWYMLYLHVIQAIDHYFGTIRRATRNIREWKVFKGEQRLSDSEWFLEHLGLARSLMTQEQFSVYASLAREKATKNIDPSTRRIYWTVEKHTSIILNETTYTKNQINKILTQLILIGFIKKLRRNPHTLPQYELSKLEGVYSVLRLED